MFLFAKTFIVISLLFEQLLEVGFAIKDTLHRSIASQRKDDLAVRTAQTRLVENFLAFFVLHHDFLGQVNGLSACLALFWS